MKKGSIDLTRGSIPVQIIQIAIPVLLGHVFQNLYNSVDSIVVGNFVGTTALAAVSSCSDISLLLVNFFSGLSIGAGVLFSRSFGAKDYDRLHRAIHTALLFAGIIGLMMAMLGIAITPLLLKLVDCPADVCPEAAAYLRIYLIGVFFTSVYNVAAGVLRALGDTRRPLYYLIAASVCNIALDLFLVMVIPLGVAGVAIATIASQLLSCILVFRKMLTTDDIYRLSLRELRLDRAILRDVLRLGLPAAVQGCVVASSNLIVQRYINAFGSTAMAGVGAAKKIDKYVSEFSQSCGLATSVFVGQNAGAKDFRRAAKGIRWTLGFGLGCVVAIGIPVCICAPALVSLFTKDPGAIGYGAEMVRTIVPFYCMLVFHQIFSNAVRGYGYSTTAMIMSMIGLIGARQLYLLISMNLHHDLHNVFVSYPVGWFSAAIQSVICYLFFIRHRIRTRGEA